MIRFLGFLGFICWLVGLVQMYGLTVGCLRFAFGARKYGKKSSTDFVEAPDQIGGKL